jgi:hypothetical protein
VFLFQKRGKEKSDRDSGILPESFYCRLTGNFHILWKRVNSACCMCSGVLDHVGAGFGAAPAGGGAIAAVLHVGMVFAFLCAAIAAVFAELAKLFGEFAVEAHDMGGGIAEGSAFEVELNAADHTFDIFFEKAGAGALLTGSGAIAACFYTFLVL